MQYPECLELFPGVSWGANYTGYFLFSYNQLISLLLRCQALYKKMSEESSQKREIGVAAKYGLQEPTVRLNTNQPR
jgi:hypothetical protein